MRLHWHRSDLRVTDNRGLAAAAGVEGADPAPGEGAVLGLFVLDDAVLDHASPPRVAFLLDALASLHDAYRDRGGDLLVRHGDPTAVLPEVAAAHDATGVVWNRGYSGLARERDAAVRDALDDAGVRVAAYHDALHHEPGSITTNAGEPYSVYTYFWKKWRDREKADPYPAPEADQLATPDDPGDLPTLADLGFDDPAAEVPPAGYEAARERLDDFLESDVYEYDDRRDYPADRCTSRLSAHLHYGTIGVREVSEAVAAARADAPDEAARESVDEFRSQLAWREFYHHVLNFNPEVVTENYKQYEHDIDWNEPGEELAAWKRGETGYPIVDAGMRQLLAEAYMHNRVRMIVASFLTKDLLLDWRHGYAHFREKLVDHDTANDNGGWQWAASTGTDAQPYFRIFNPMTQGERYDPAAEYITRYVPELEGVNADDIHSWHELSRSEREQLAPEYPAPIVDHSERREQALAMFKRARGEDPDEE
ncbi:cryptochrome/photolyase family protein [Haloglomus litoreum]|uniref:cryptochrome/photolyase family protein n=1 Tax=Haloglomus litoreum TaxID=3034026 RepID=UPI0023E77D1F|nr:deoxyribodipyrimidine photo-lyase [Haloglomus sp. DT116]